MNFTENYNFSLPTNEDFVDIEDLNDNFFKIDKMLKEIEEGNSGVKLLESSDENPVYLYDLPRGVYVAVGKFFVSTASATSFNIPYKQLLLKGSTGETTALRYAIICDPVNIKYNEYKLKSDGTYELTTHNVAALEKTSNKVRIITEDATDTQYPSAKAVYTALQDVKAGNGVTYIPSVSNDGVISWANDGGLSNPEPINIKGPQGPMPIKGIDYFTAEDKAEIVNDVLDSIGVPVFGVVGENNEIILTGNLEHGTYTVKYEYENGNTVNVGNIIVAEELINLVPTSIDVNGNIYNGTGYKEGYRFNSSKEEVEETTTAITGYIELKPGKKLILQPGNGWNNNDSNSTKCYIAIYYDNFYCPYSVSEKNLRNSSNISGVEFPANGGVSITSSTISDGKSTFENIKYVRFSALKPGATITVYEKDL